MSSSSRSRPSGTFRNRILLGLPESERQSLTASFEAVDLRPRDVLFDIDRPIEFVYFVEYGVVSIVAATPDGTAVETATVGPEGFVGLPVFLGSDRSTSQAFCQIAGRALRLPVAAFNAEIDRGGALVTALKRYTLAHLTQISQASACNRLHTMRERCARWLLQCHDRVLTDTFNVTQDFLAQMLGVRRATVSEAAGALQDARLIQYEYGRITILDRDRLEQTSCECYAIIAREFARLVDNKNPPSLFSAERTARDGRTTMHPPRSTPT